MKTRSTFAVAAVVALLLSLAVVGTAGAAAQTFPAASAVGAVGFQDQGATAHAAFAARATGPAMPGEMHQPAAGFLFYKDRAGLAFMVSVMHIHAHSGTEVHFGGTITWASDPSLVGKSAHCAAVDGGSPGTAGDRIGILVTDTGACPCESEGGMHMPTFPVTFGNLVVKASAMM